MINLILKGSQPFTLILPCIQLTSALNKLNLIFIRFLGVPIKQLSTPACCLHPRNEEGDSLLHHSIQLLSLMPVLTLENCCSNQDEFFI